MSHLLVGTSGFSYGDWVGPVYPEGTPSSRFLELYAEMFSFVEINYSYYRQPDAQTMQAMAARAGETFRFAVKAHRSMTHEMQSDLSVVSSEFRKGVAPLAAAGRLAAVLVQFPYSFHYAPAARRRLDQVLQHLAGLPVAVEFRNDEWQRQSVYRELERREVATVIVDAPRLPRLPQPDLVTTSPVAYLRFHGRNRENWWTGNNVTRYDYCYSAREIDEWVPRIEELLQRVRLLIVSFNNHYHGQAAANATQLLDRLQSH